MKITNLRIASEVAIGCWPTVPSSAKFPDRRPAVGGDPFRLRSAQRRGVFRTIVFFVLCLGGLTASRAQSPPDPTVTPDGGSGSSTDAGNPSPPRNIMPLSINHKPNPTAPPPEIAEPIDKFFKTLKTGDYVTAYNTFLEGTRLGSQTEKKSFFISKTEDAFGIYGKLNDAEVYDNYSVGSNVIVLTYLTRHDLQPLRWRFIYYRPDKTWVLINMGFDDVLLDMLD